MNLKEITALALAGYKKKDIDAMIEAENTDPAPADPKPADPAPADPDAGNGPKEGPNDDPDPDDHGGDDDIQKQLEEAQKQVKELTAKLEKAQKDNTKKDVDDHKDAAAERDKRLADRARSMM